MKMIFKGKYVDYPLSIKSIFQMGILSPLMSFLSFLKSYIKILIIFPLKIHLLTYLTNLNQ